MASIDPAATADVLSKTLSEITEHSQIYIHPNVFPFATAAIRRILSLLTQALLATMSLAGSSWRDVEKKHEKFQPPIPPSAAPAGPLVDDRVRTISLCSFT